MLLFYTQFQAQQTIVVPELSLPRLLMLMRVKGGLTRGVQLCVLVEGTKLSAGHVIPLLY